jgi:hypothetical protein
LRGLKDFEYAVKDLDEAEKLMPAEKDPAKLRKQYQEDAEHEERI